MKAQHTRGPWRQEAAHDYPGNFYIAADDVFRVAIVCGGIDIAELGANARLIAASPAMIDALERITLLLAGSKGKSAEAYSLALDALKQAKGEAQ